MNSANRSTTIILVAVIISVLFGLLIVENIGASRAIQTDDSTSPEVEFIPEEDTALQNESVSITLQVHNQVNEEKVVLVRVYEPYGGIAGFRADGEAPYIPQNNTRMWQSYEGLEPRQRLVVPITIEPGSQSDEYMVYTQIKYFNESGKWTEKWVSASLEIQECSVRCKIEQLGKTIVDTFATYRNEVIALLSLTVAILSLSVTIRRE